MDETCCPVQAARGSVVRMPLLLVILVGAGGAQAGVLGLGPSCRAMTFPQLSNCMQRIHVASPGNAATCAQHAAGCQSVAIEKTDPIVNKSPDYPSLMNSRTWERPVSGTSTSPRTYIDFGESKSLVNGAARLSRVSLRLALNGIKRAVGQWFEPVLRLITRLASACKPLPLLATLSVLIAPVPSLAAVHPIGAVPTVSRLLYLSKQALLARAGLALFASVTSLLLIGGYAYQRATGTRFADAAFKAYILLNDVPGADVVAEEDTAPRSVAVALHLIGVLVFSVLLGIVSDGISTSLGGMRTSNGRLFERGHTVVLNYGRETVPVLRQLEQAHREGRLKSDCVVVLADVPKENLDAAVSERIGGGLRVVTREGSPTELLDLQRVCAGTARRVVVTVPTGVAGAVGAAEGEEQDCSAALRGATGLVSALQASAEPKVERRAAVVVSAPRGYESFRSELATDMRRSLRSYAEVCSTDFISRLLAQCARTPGLSCVYEEILLQGKGNEIYVSEAVGKGVPSLSGRTFEQLAESFPHAVPLGIVSQSMSTGASGESGEAVELAPSPKRRLAPTDKLVLLARSKRQARPSAVNLRMRSRDGVGIGRQVQTSGGLAPRDGYGVKVRKERRGASAMAAAAAAEPNSDAERAKEEIAPQHVFLMNWSPQMVEIASELDLLLPRGSRVTLIADEAPAGFEKPQMRRVPFKHLQLDAASPADLTSAGVSTADCVLVLQKQGGDDVHSLLCVHALAAAMREQGRALDDAGGPRLIAELTEPSMRALFAEQLRLTKLDLLLPLELASGALVQFAVQPSLRAIYEELLSPSGDEIYMRPAHKYLERGDETPDGSAAAGAERDGAKDGAKDGTKSAALSSAKPRTRLPADSFEALSAEARRRGEVLIGVHRARDELPVLNPRGKRKSLRLLPGDQLVLLGDAF